MSGHTPGPWEVREGPNDSRAFDVYAGSWKVHHGAWGREADAHLIAAAPDLLGLLVLLRDEWFEPHYGTNDVGYAALLRDRIRAVIAKAEGR